MATTRHIDVRPEDEGRTLQALLHDRGAFSHAEAKGLIDAGAVRGRPPVRPGDYARRVAAGERFEIRRDPGRRYRPRPAARPGKGFRVVHRDREILVIDKSADLLSVPTALRREESLVERLLEAERQRGVRRPVLFAVNRLDRDTSGLLLFARSRAAHDALRGQFQTRSVDRRYVAVAEGRLEKDRGRLESRLVEDPGSLKVHSTRDPRSGRMAITEYEVSERLKQATVLSVRLLTGRKNQIRVHLAEAGHPLVGDRRYGAPSPHIGRTALHARALGFAHPATGRHMEFVSPLPRDLRRLIRALRSRDGGDLRYP